MIIFNRLWLVCLLLCGALLPLSSVQAVTIKIATLSPEGHGVDENAAAGGW